MALQHLRSSTANKRPTPASMADGQLAINTPAVSPGLFFKDAAGALVKVGPVHVGTTAPNASPASGGTAGNSVGEQWLDTTGGTYVFKVWDGSAWRSESGTFVDASGDVMTGALGIIAGTAAAPGLYVSGDTNTGLYSPGADQLSLTTGGTERMRIDSSGRVGIGGASSVEALSVVRNIDGGTTAYGIYSGGTIQPAVTASASYFSAGAFTAASAFTLNEIRYFNVAQGTFGVGSSVASQYGFIVSASLTGATNNYGFFSNIPSGTGRWNFYSGGTADSYFASNNFIFANGGTERARIDSSGRLLVGTSTERVFNNGAVTPRLQLEGLDVSAAAFGLARNSANTGGPVIAFGKSRGSTAGSMTAAIAQDDLGRIQFQGADGTQLQQAAEISAHVDGTPGANDMPGRLVFSTTADGASSPTERMRITADGKVGIGTAAPITTLHVSDAAGARIRAGGAAGAGYEFNSSSTRLDVPEANTIAAYTSDTERARIESSGRLLVGTSASLGVPVSSSTLNNCRHQQQGPGQAEASAFYSAYSTTSTVGANIILGRSRGSTGTQGLVSNGDALGRVVFLGSDGQAVGTDAGFLRGAVIEAAVDGVAAAGSMPGRLVFSTTANGSASPTERMRIDSSGRIGFNSTSLGGASGNYRFGGNISGATSSPGILYTPTTQPDVTTSSSAFQTQPSTASNGAVPYTITNLFHYQAVQGSFNADSTVTNQYGFAVNASVTGGTNNYGFYSNLSSATGRWNFYANGTADSYFASNNFIFANGGTERVRIDSSGRLLVGTSTSVDQFGVTPQGQFTGTTGAGGYLGLTVFNTAADSAPSLVLGHSKGGSVGTYTASAADDLLGQISFTAANGTDMRRGVFIAGYADATWGTNDHPGRLVFATTADGAASPTEQLRISNGGTVIYNQPAPAAVDVTATLTVANLTAKIITSSTAAAVTMTLPTGTLMDGGFSGLYNNMAFEWSVINTGATNAVTVQGGTGHTVVGSGTVAANNSVRFVSRRTAATTWVTYRIS